MNIDNTLLPILKRINFGERYSQLCAEYCDFSNRLRKWDHSVIKVFFKSKNLEVTYSKVENFYILTEHLGSFSIQFNIIPDNGFMQFVLDIKRDGVSLDLGWGTWESITRELVDDDIKKPVFTSEEDISKILSFSYDIFQDLTSDLRKMNV